MIRHSARDRSLRHLLALLALAPVTATCSSNQRPQAPPPATCDLPQNIHMVLRGSERLNLNDDGRSLPVVVRIYQLKSSARLEEALFEDVWRRERDTLGDDVIKVDEVYVYPGQRVARAFRREDAATTVAAVAIFRHPAGTSWRTLYELPPAPGDERCAAQSANPSANPPPVSDPHYNFYLEDYFIEAGGDDIEDRDAGLRLPDGGLRRLPNTLPGRTRVPAVPSRPGTPSLPNAPNLPNAPQTPQAPSAPQAPQAPQAPSMPQAPSAPSAPSLKASADVTTEHRA